MKSIIFSEDSVASIEDERKTQTRRVVNPQPDRVVLSPQACKGNDFLDGRGKLLKCPYGEAGDVLYVKEVHYLYGKWEVIGKNQKTGRPIRKFVADWSKGARFSDELRYVPIQIETDKDKIGWFKRSPLFMPRKIARLFIKLEDVSVEKLDNITDEDALAEGIYLLSWGDYGFKGEKRMGDLNEGDTAVDSFISLWDSINEKRGYGWARNPYVWKIKFSVDSMKTVTYTGA